ncbi:MAG: Cytosine-specific methyltransferase [Candidatus Magasanikbacteria bacterium GW2011_GWD2_43_18]|uniref:DNA (cytosine-5-)-methyltransferase n=1 Tax=Candidatus Magasanikbacteria bacterium GW2011_GWE2_42_7 TaxID=1619052 RepID=A0A0G1BC42_9BACT|nr:MAG: Cytosine-specific methyltransferase [Candidatus Magasanikbacteria bacterium GW2011_GWC2_42_27]KKS70940.1 MAG: Cytosine-specific methyltransferase [Candidatus Magasanikbacteria bacterium GW2011_GWE2_42_7]KKT03944.1 MAG: Cytosine-specific methyltransferase [Candidatus Magasanikbacteria bacterium GW2011_GWD2_43_18]KKT25573.1 MAG: Cytosine-specific methyltransferase [Candidatus Magasanikbacteria bacterium GW2011_GWA2_43_9]HBB37751.1 DNA (cytosine-5-)-methyltransferase [Candidatus Magasanikb
MKSQSSKIKVVDLFCGIGGLTHGLIKEGLDVVAGIDNDSSCKFGYEYNNKTQFIDSDILKVTPDQINKLFGTKKGTIRVLAGCAPCQPFSRLNLKKVTEKQLEPLGKFAQLIAAIQPDIVSMENVSGLADTNKYPVFAKFIKTLVDNGYKYKYEVVDVSEFGVPQKRKRLVLLASRFGEIELIKRTHKDKRVTVRDVIRHLEPIKDGQTSKKDPLHKARKLDPINLERIKATPHNGGNSESWSEDLMLTCHKKASGKTYRSTVYGRMRWDEPAPTMTTQCIGLGNGRFGHPTQNRAISLREAAIFQTFPENYKFTESEDAMVVTKVAKFIGNAVPVRLGSVIGKSIKNHLKYYEKQ